MAAAVAAMRNKERRERDKNDEAKKTLKAASLGETDPAPCSTPARRAIAPDLIGAVYRGAKGWAAAATMAMKAPQKRYVDLRWPPPRSHYM